MDTLLAYSTLALALATVVLAVATVVMAREAKESSYRQIRVQTWIEFAKRFDSTEMMRARQELAKQMRSYTEKKHDKVSETVLNFFEDVATLYLNKYMDKKLAIDMFSYHGARWWEVMKKYVDFERKCHKEDGTMFHNFEKFASDCRLDGEIIDNEEINNFLTGEEHLLPRDR